MNILLLEPNYKNKYPPLSLMKLATFHKQLEDKVVFSKGENKELKGKEWHRIYINSLFTFEWKATQKMIKFAYELTKNKSIIYLGGIAATLITDFIANKEPEINIIKGLLNRPGTLGFIGEENIDYLPPDYSILDQIEYKYPNHDAYFTYSTRGCGMNCSFCAVQRLEPQFIDYIDIKQQINHVKELYGEKRHLMLMDNNVLKSPRLSEIIDDIVELGFGAGNARMKNPATGKSVKRYVDFNQGLDANFLTPEKARQLARIELKPVRIAFDHIMQKDKYEKAIRTCFDEGLTTFSNYILYNSDEASWKGQAYEADTPDDLYYRLKFNVDLCEKLQAELDEQGINKKVEFFSFPMRYIPLNDTERGYVGTHWNKKQLRAIQIFLTPTQGKGVSSRSFFEAAFGNSIETFKLALQMPEVVIRSRGGYRPRKNDSDEIKNQKYQKHLFNLGLINEWNNLYKEMISKNIWNVFFDRYIRENTFSLDVISQLSGEIEKRMYLYYLTPEKIKNHFEEINNKDKEIIRSFKDKSKYYGKLMLI